TTVPASGKVEPPAVVINEKAGPPPGNVPAALPDLPAQEKVAAHPPLDLTTPPPTPAISIGRRPLFWAALGGAAGGRAPGGVVAVGAVFASPSTPPMGNLNPFVFGR